MNKALLTTLLLCAATLAQAQEQRTVQIAGVETVFIAVPSGTFTMGSSESDPHAQGDELPAKEVTIDRGYYFGATEVTQALWEAVMHYNPSVFPDPQRPVEMISWHDCKRFIDTLNSMWQGEGSFRLPTEAEWEYAARLGRPDYRNEDGTISTKKLQRYGWFYSRAEGRSHPVATKQADEMGFFDLQGNVWEWCEDWKRPYDEPAAEAASKVYRGGSWFNEPQALREANRHGHPPDTRFTNAGLRLVWQVE